MEKELLNPKREKAALKEKKIQNKLQIKLGFYSFVV